ncbi:hypothetical protein ACVWZ6_004340 [Bradyrhizobium sp. GM6.1]
MMPRDQFLRDVIADLRMAASFVTILPVALSKPAADGAVARATWALPVAGLLVGLAGALVYKVASLLGLSPNLAALLALAATALVTGALHEDGLADTADGLGGGRTRERKLEIMRDSRIGTYGVCGADPVVRPALERARDDRQSVGRRARTVRCAHCGPRGLAGLHVAGRACAT